VEVQRATITCHVCRAEVTELRRGRCWGCYSRWVEARPVGRGAACLVCFEKRRDELKMMELLGRSVPMCHGCAARIIRLDQIPATMSALRKALRRDRREGDRRTGGLDRRIPTRDAGAAAAPADDHLPDLNDVIIELEEADLEIVEQTTVKGGQAK